MKELEQKALRLLTGSGFNIKGYYPYDSVIDIVGYFHPTIPFKNPTKIIVEIRADKPTIETIDGFFKLGKNTIAEKMILFTIEEFDKLTPEAQSLISKLNIEYFGPKTLDKILEEMKAATLDVSKLTNACDVFSPIRLSEALPDLAKQVIPKDIKTFPNVKRGKFSKTLLLRSSTFVSVLRPNNLAKNRYLNTNPKAWLCVQAEQEVILV